MFCLVVVVVKLLLLAQCLAIKTALRTPVRGKETISTKPMPKSACDLFGLVCCFIVFIVLSPAIPDILHTAMARTACLCCKYR